MSITRMFAIAGLISGTLSGLTAMTSVGLWTPGILFGLALAISLDRMYSEWSEFESALLVAGTLLAYWISIAALYLTTEVLGFRGVIVASLISGCCSGFAGSFLVALAIKALSPVELGRAKLLWIAMIGGLLGSAFMMVASFGEIFDSIWSLILGLVLPYALWQSGVSTAIASCLDASFTTRKSSAKGSRVSRDEQNPFHPPV